MKKHNCEECKRRQAYDNNPKSLTGRFWRWHIGFCPGWKSYMASLDDNKRQQVIEKYELS